MSEKIDFNTVVYGFNRSSSYEYGDFYLTTDYTCAIEFSYQAGGELGKNVYSVCKDIINKNNGETKMGQYERFEFYEKAREAYAVIATSESALYANIILQKGVIK